MFNTPFSETSLTLNDRIQTSLIRMYTHSNQVAMLGFGTKLAISLANLSPSIEFLYQWSIDIMKVVYRCNLRRHNGEVVIKHFWSGGNFHIQKTRKSATYRIFMAIAVASISMYVYKYVIHRIAICYAAWGAISTQIGEKHHRLLCKSTLYLYLYCI